MECNGRNCGKPRDEVDGGTPDDSLRASAMKSQAPPGSWVCVSCSNVNWPTRMECNGRNCGKPRDEVDGGPADTPSAPAGAWECTSCGNVNWPQRTVCNKRDCG